MPEHDPTSYRAANVYEDLPQYDRDLIDQVLGKDRHKILHPSTERTMVDIPKGLKRMYERIGYEDAYIKKLQNEAERLGGAVRGLETAVQKGKTVGATNQFKAYSERYFSTVAELDTLRHIRSCQQAESLGGDA